MINKFIHVENTNSNNSDDVFALSQNDATYTFEHEAFKSIFDELDCEVSYRCKSK